LEGKRVIITCTNDDGSVEMIEADFVIAAVLVDKKTQEYGSFSFGIANEVEIARSIDALSPAIESLKKGLPNITSILELLKGLGHKASAVRESIIKAPKEEEIKNG